MSFVTGVVLGGVGGILCTLTLLILWGLVLANQDGREIKELTQRERAADEALDALRRAFLARSDGNETRFWEEMDRGYLALVRAGRLPSPEEQAGMVIAVTRRIEP